MTHTTNTEPAPGGIEEIAARYVTVWNEPDPLARRSAVAGLWAPDGVEIVEGTRFRGHRELGARIADAHREFVESGKYTVTSAGDAVGDRDHVTFTIQLTSNDEVAWAARVFLLLDEDGLVRRDYQFTVKSFDVQ
ncbi:MULTISPECIES: hypothetical protein [Actinomadura]|uniref:SnoaL-like domain-containing protein n=1 Tax=Actinomadura yumaensis TaxID=111807 RepID=A0ABW2CF23_9ACTN|nr:hypothetical protein [Actinomadura sp. J1-007]MWK35618.1 hypothetical protein [Actinomadura sp. J1-007]